MSVKGECVCIRVVTGGAGDSVMVKKEVHEIVKGGDTQLVV